MLIFDKAVEFAEPGLARMCLLLIAVMGVMNALWMAKLDIGFDWSYAIKPLVAIIFLLILSFQLSIKQRRKRLAHATFWLALLAAYSMVSATSTFLFSSLGGPLKDSWFAMQDSAMGLDWIAVLSFATQFPWLGKLMTLVYLSSLPFVIVTITVLAKAGQHKRIELFVVSLMVASIITILLSVPLAAVGPYIFYSPSLELYKEFAPAVMPNGPDSLFVTHFMGMRDGSLDIISLSGYDGLVQFPSFHTSMSLLMVCAVRHCRVFFWLSCIVNLIIMLTLPLEGNHYFVDLPAGALVAVIAWLMVRKLERMLAKQKIVPESDEARFE